MILITGAAGKTGKSILASLTMRGAKVRALVHTPEQAEEVKKLGKPDIVIGDLRNYEDLEKAMPAIDRIYFIAPNMAPDELEIGKNLIELARKYHVQRFVYHSVLHPQIEAMPHHWQKMRMEEQLFASGLDFTILQPCAYMQNILAGWNHIVNDGKYVIPYSVNSRLSIIDLEDVSQVAADVITQLTHSYAIYELAGPEALSQLEVAEQLSQCLGRPVIAEEQSRGDWEQNARKSGMREQAIRWLLKMFEYYDQHGLVGNPSTIEHLLGRKPVTLHQFLTRYTSSINGHA